MISIKTPRLFISAVITAMGWLLIAPAVGDNLFSGAAVVYTQDDWKKEFDDICSKTQDAMAYSEEELNKLVVRCDKLKPVIENLGETQRKVFLKRLSLCRNIFVFALEPREKK